MFGLLGRITSGNSGCPLPSALWARDGIGESRDRAGSWGGGLVGHGQVTAAEDPSAYSAPMQNKCLSQRM